MAHSEFPIGEAIEGEIVRGRLNVVRKDPAVNVVVTWLDDEGRVNIGRKDRAGNVVIHDEDGNEGAVITPEKLELKSNDRTAILLNADLPTAIGLVDQSQSKAYIYSNGLEFRDSQDRPIVRLDRARGNLAVGGREAGGNIGLFSTDQALSDSFSSCPISLSADQGRVYLRKGNNVITLAANSNEIVMSKGNTNTLVIDGTKGDIVFQNADCAEEFDILQSEVNEIDNGTVLVMDDETDKLRKSYKPYDRKVAGIVSGASNYKPAIVLDKRTSGNKRVPVALMGKVYCKVDAEYDSVHKGDLLTTSGTMGYAMKATDPVKSIGSVVGKSLGILMNGRGLLPVLASMQ